MLSDIQNNIETSINKLFNNEEEKEEAVNMYDEFKIPILYLDKPIYKLNETILDDLELQEKEEELEEETYDISDNDISNNKITQSMYNHLVNPNNEFSNKMIKKINVHYTTFIPYLKDTQSVIKNTPLFEKYLIGEPIDCDRFMEIWHETKENNFFLEKYCYIDWNIFKRLNKSSRFLQFLSIINLSSPVLSFIIPFIFMVLPFVILRIQNIPITFDKYFELLRTVAKTHFIGQILNIRNINFSSLLYVLFTIGMYCMQIYQNVNTCIRFYNNISKINNYLYDIKNYIIHTISSMNSFITVNRDLIYYENFCCDVNKNLAVLKKLHNDILGINQFKPAINKIGEIGYLLKMFYILHSDKEYETALKYSVGYNGYISHIKEIHNNIENGYISYAEFNTKDKTSFKNQYYPPYSKENHIKNNCLLSKNIITGPNASGKTTYLKTTALNVIFSQQYGVGFYKKCSLNPYEHIHSYLNIPDTSGRDSLFQAESRRCKEIIDNINKNENERHFTIFDELFSGTNPSEASKSAYAFLVYLNKFKNVDFILTTHYVNICKKLEKKTDVKNYKMDVELNNNKIKYTYKIKKGISKVKGAILILEEMNYPCEIIYNIKKS